MNQFGKVAAYLMMPLIVACSIGCADENEGLKPFVASDGGGGAGGAGADGSAGTGGAGMGGAGADGSAGMGGAGMGGAGMGGAGMGDADGGNIIPNITCSVHARVWGEGTVAMGYLVGATITPMGNTELGPCTITTATTTCNFPSLTPGMFSFLFEASGYESALVMKSCVAGGNDDVATTLAKTVATTPNTLVPREAFALQAGSCFDMAMSNYSWGASGMMSLIPAAQIAMVEMPDSPALTIGTNTPLNVCGVAGNAGDVTVQRTWTAPGAAAVTDTFRVIVYMVGALMSADAPAPGQVRVTNLQ